MAIYENIIGSSRWVPGTPIFLVFFFCSFMTGPSPNMSQLRIQAFLAYVAPPPRYSPHFREWIAWPATWWTWGCVVWTFTQYHYIMNGHNLSIVYPARWCPPVISWFINLSISFLPMWPCHLEQYIWDHWKHKTHTQNLSSLFVCFGLFFVNVSHICLLDSECSKDFAKPHWDFFLSASFSISQPYFATTFFYQLKLKPFWSGSANGETQRKQTRISFAEELQHQAIELIGKLLVDVVFALLMAISPILMRKTSIN